MTTGLRERKKAATRQALHAAAVDLAMRHGVENLTVEAIADAATVSRRTFSNYFASKEQALLHGDRSRTVRLVELLRARPEQESLMTALIGAAEAYSAEYDAEPSLEQSYRALRLHPALLPELVATYAAGEQELAAVIERRLPAEPDNPLRAWVLAATFLACLRVVGQAALENGAEQNMVDLVRQALAITREGFR
ncbi:TetR/AcrR family transcriptional regulator [Streptomyces sp. NBC_01497]|uniref:TetR/AcrR family transcriptional regulator n=1 Tax=Streptomyces sp. NBC_01497 TaxID=2903885 RepID=UPI002E3056D6|nr:TetR/AcrR family transcriptional regulator [Streptomyces sp. NBC_01497]